MNPHSTNTAIMRKTTIATNPNPKHSRNSKKPYETTNDVKKH